MTVPGTVGALYRLTDQYGTLEFADLLEPAIDHARQGVPITEYIASQ